MKVLILHDKVDTAAPPDEQDTLEQANFIGKIIQSLGYEFATHPCTSNLKQLKKDLKAIKPDIVFNLVETIEGDGKLVSDVPALLEKEKIPFTGNSSEAIHITSHKILTKLLLQQNQLPTPYWYENTYSEHAFTPQKMIIKPICQDASIGIDENAVVTINTENELEKYLAQKEKTVGQACFAETFIEGREFNVSLLGTPDNVEVLPIAEMLFLNFGNREKILSYNDKWYLTQAQRSFKIPAGDKQLFENIKQVSLECWRLFKLNGYVRVDFRADENNQIYILEINANPCLSYDAGFIAACHEAHLSDEFVISKILQCTIPHKIKIFT